MDLADYLRASQRTLIFTGAGISTGSGIPGFSRTTRRLDAATARLLSGFHDLRSSPDRALGLQARSLGCFPDAQPNEVHQAIVRLEEAGKLQVVVTQNIDGLHSLAGTSPSGWWNCTAPIRSSNARAATGAAIPNRISIFFGRSHTAALPAADS